MALIYGQGPWPQTQISFPTGAIAPGTLVAVGKGRLHKVLLTAPNNGGIIVSFFNGLSSAAPILCVPIAAPKLDPQGSSMWELNLDYTTGLFMVTSTATLKVTVVLWPR
jgi:hypothetical protein